MKFLENLEARQFLSASPLSSTMSGPLLEPSSVAVPLATAKLVKLVGTYTGTMTVISADKATVKITSQKANGTFAGKGSTSSPSQFTLQGQIKANRKATVHGSGTGKYGSFTYAGTGTVSSDGKTLTCQFKVVLGGHTYNGSLVVHRK